MILALLRFFEKVEVIKHELVIYCTKDIPSKDLVLKDVMVQQLLQQLLLLFVSHFVSSEQIPNRDPAVTSFQDQICSDSRLSSLGWLEVQISLLPLPLPLLSSTHQESRYPYLTMLFQLLAMVYLGYVSLHHYVPDIFIDTVGVPFMYPLVKLFGCHVITYVHYPLLSSVRYAPPPLASPLPLFVGYVEEGQGDATIV
jgi:hypothetical protein